ncbi:NAC domain-containing protein 71 [Ricinus communis]|uniref:NAC domain-containing protein 71 n=1 Tax=Ricinus communis TaxID=3988 RepID=UPI00201AFD1D|nr:NAC domain-containing protein 71 [Ricinus communis]
MALPPGFRFDPTDTELFSHYLYKKINGTLLPMQKLYVTVCDLYGQNDPWIIWDKFGGNSLTEKDDLYFFSKLKKKTDKSCKRFDRTVGVDRKGTWSGEKLDKTIQFKLSSSHNRTIQGLKKRFSYENPTVP